MSLESEERILLERNLSKMVKKNLVRNFPEKKLKKILKKKIFFIFPTFSRGGRVSSYKFKSNRKFEKPCLIRKIIENI